MKMSKYRHSNSSGGMLPGSSGYEIKIEEYLSLVRQLVYKIKTTLPNSTDIDELYSAGVLGLIEATKRFDPSQNVPFSAFARYRIRGSMLDYLRSLDPLSLDVRKKVKQMDKIIGDYQKKNGEKPEVEEIKYMMEASGSSLNAFTVKAKDYRIISFDEMTSLRNGMEDSNFTDPLYLLEMNEMKQAVVKSIKKLQPREQQILAMYYQERLTMKEIAEILGITESRVCQIHARCIKLFKTRLVKYTKDR